MAIFYVDPLNGSDSDDGSQPTAGQAGIGPKATLLSAYDAAVTGDVVYVMATAAESPSSTIALDSGSQGNKSLVKIQVADSSGVPSESLSYEINDSSLAAGTPLVTVENIPNTEFRGINFVCSGNASHCVKDITDTVDSLGFSRCVFDGATSHNINLSATKGPQTLRSCTIRNAGGDGVHGDSVSYSMEDCVVTANGGSGVRTSTGGRYDRTIFAHNGGWGVETTNGNFDTARRCTFFSNASGGLRDDQKSGSAPTVASCTFAQNGGYGIFFNDNVPADFGDVEFFTNNHFHLNTSGDTNAVLADISLFSITGDPDFADAAGGDFVPSSTSPLRGAGFNGGDIGAVDAAGSGLGGGTTLVLPSGLRSVM